LILLAYFCPKTLVLLGNQDKINDVFSFATLQKPEAYALNEFNF